MREFSKFLATLMLLVLFMNQAFAGTFWVDTNSNADANTCLEDESVNDDDCTFRDALSQLGASDTIRFMETLTMVNSSQTAYTTISVSDSTIDGLTDGKKIALNGSATNADGLAVTGDRVRIKGLYIYGYDGGSGRGGINVNSTVNSITISDNIIGLRTDGTTIDGNDRGIYISGKSVTIADNTISGNNNSGIAIRNGASDILIKGNKIGTTADGNTVKANNSSGNSGNAGIDVSGTSLNMNGGNGGLEGLLIGGDSSAERNIISGNNSSGVRVGFTGDSITATVKIQNNYIGVKGDGATAAGNTGHGIHIFDPVPVTIQDNVISNNSSNGVWFEGGGTTITMTGNKIGTTATGNTAAGNSSAGIDFSSSSIVSIVIGGATAALSNVISANARAAIQISNVAAITTPISIKGNSFGIGANGTTTASMGNGNSGINAFDGALTIGGDNSLGSAGTGTIAEGNVISNNANSGIYAATQGSAKVGSLNVYGNIIGLKKGATGVYDTVAGNGTGTQDRAGIKISRNSSLTAVNIGAVGPTIASSKRNIISGNYEGGIEIDSITPTTVNIKNNYIGLDWSGTLDRGNVNNGLFFYNTNYINTYNIGGTSSNEGNVISGNDRAGVDIEIPGTFNIYANYIGTNAAGTAALGNGSSSYLGINRGGIFIDTVSSVSVVTIGGTRGINDIGQGNVISGNYGQGILIGGGTGVVIKGNYIGLGADGTTAIGNQVGSSTYSLADTDTGFNGSGIIVMDSGYDGESGLVQRSVNDPKIGGTTVSEGNVIVNNAGYGIAVVHDSVGYVGLGQNWVNGFIRNNFIGVLANGTTLAKNNAAREIYANPNGASISNFSLGNASYKNIINNTNHLGAKFVNITPTNEETIDTDNTWTTTTNLSYSFWERRQSAEGAILNFGPQQCYDGVDNDNDGKVDFGVDSGCNNIRDESENSEGTGGAFGHSGGGGSSNAGSAGNDSTVGTESEDSVSGEINEVDGDDASISFNEDEGGDESANTDKTIEEDLDSAQREPSVAETEAKKEFIDSASVVVDFVLSPVTDEEIVTEQQQLLATTLDSIADGDASEEEIEEAEKIATELIKISLADAVNSAGASGEFTIIRQGKPRKINKNTKVEFTFDAKKAEERQAEAYEKGENKLIIGPSTIIGGGVSALLQIQEGAELGDFLSSEKVYFKGLKGLKDKVASKKDLIPEIPEITNLDDQEVPEKFLAWAAGTKPGEELGVSLIDEDKVYEGPKFVVGDDYKALILIDIDEFGIEIEETKEFDILLENKQGEGSSVSVKINPELDFAIDALNLEATLSGYSVPGTIIFVSWKSFVLNSVVVADASQGYFEVEVPADLQEGEHTVLVYAYNKEKNWMSNIATLIFNR